MYRLRYHLKPRKPIYRLWNTRGRFTVLLKVAHKIHQIYNKAWQRGVDSVDIIVILLEMKTFTSQYKFKLSE